MVMFSLLRTDLREAIHCGLPSPVSMRIREEPRPTMYVFVPMSISCCQKRYGNARTLQGELEVCQSCVRIANIMGWRLLYSGFHQGP